MSQVTLPNTRLSGDNELIHLIHTKVLLALYVFPICKLL
jgi:hypothetical protein